MQISVTGEQRIRVAPERAEVHLNVQAEDTVRAKVLKLVADTANELAAELKSLQDAGAVERHTVSPLRTYAWQEHRNSPERVTATVEITARFADFEALGRFVADWATRSAVQLGWVNWVLTDATADRLRDECIGGAVQRAKERAEAMARAAGAGPIEIIEIADPGLLGQASVQTMYGGPMMASADARMMKGGREAATVAVVPEELEIGAQLNLRFATTH